MSQTTEPFRHQVHEWSGTAYDIGRKHGRALRREIIDEFEPSLQSLVAQVGHSEAKVLDRVVQRLQPVFAHYVPRALEEIHGLAEGAELSFGRAFFAAVRDRLCLPLPGETANEEGGCTSFFCGQGTTRAGEILVGQTKDNQARRDRYHIMRLNYYDGQSVIALNYPGWCANICLTSDGLSFAGNSLAAVEPKGETVPISLLKRLVMEKKTLSEVLSCIDGLAFPPGCFILGDASGHGVCIEYAGGRTDVRDISGQAYGHANTVLAEGLQEFARPAASNSGLRQKNIQRLLDEKCGSLSASELKTITSDHTDYPNSICRHSSPDDSNVTTAAFVADLTNLEMHIAIGKPCTVEYQNYSFGRDTGKS